MEIKYLNIISQHKFVKLLRSKIYWMFFIVGLGILLTSMIPLLVAEELRNSQAAFFLISQFARTYSIFGLFASITIGAIVLMQDIRDGTIFPFLAKPISRQAFILGKIYGAYKLMLIFWLFQILYYLIFIYAATDYSLTMNMVLTFIFDLMFYFMMITVTVFFSTFINPIWASIVVSVTYFLPSIAKLMIHTEWGIWTTISRVVWYVGPEYNILSNWDSIVSSTLLYDTSTVQKLAYFFTLMLLLLLPTFRIFTKRNLTPKD